MRGHRGVQGGAAWGESLAFSIVLSTDAAHELSHAVAVVVSRLEGMLSN